MSETAYVLLTCEVGKDELVKSSLKEVKDVKEVKRTFGAYDVIVKVNADDKKSLRDTITNCVKTQDNVKTALTLNVLDPIF